MLLRARLSSATTSSPRTKRRPTKRQAGQRAHVVFPVNLQGLSFKNSHEECRGKKVTHGFYIEVITLSLCRGCKTTHGSNIRQNYVMGSFTPTTYHLEVFRFVSHGWFCTHDVPVGSFLFVSHGWFYTHNVPFGSFLFVSHG